MVTADRDRRPSSSSEMAPDWGFGLAGHDDFVWGTTNIVIHQCDCKKGGRIIKTVAPTTATNHLSNDVLF